MTPLADLPEAAEEATKFEVPAAIAARDYIIDYHLALQPPGDATSSRARVVAYYFADGDRTATRLDELITRHHAHAGRRLSLLEFATNYGCVTRHLRKRNRRYELVACDFHPEAIRFLRDVLETEAMLSSLEPSDFAPGRTFDVVFALYFFSHTGPRTFGRWIEALYNSLAEDGLLIFITHGRVPYEDVGRPALDPLGFWFLQDNDRRHLPTEEYGHMVVPPSYVIECIGRCPGAALVAFEEALWWGKQDVYVVRKTRTAFQAKGDIDRLARALAAEQDRSRALEVAIEAIRRSTSWRLTAPLRGVRRLLQAPHQTG